MTIRTAQAWGRVQRPASDNGLWRVAIAEPDHFYNETVVIIHGAKESEVLTAFALYESLLAHGIETVAQVDALAKSTLELYHKAAHNANTARETYKQIVSIDVDKYYDRYVFQSNKCKELERENELLRLTMRQCYGDI